MIYTHIVGLESLILHAKFFVEIGPPDFEGILLYMTIDGHGSHLDHVT